MIEYNPWPCGKLPPELQRPELEQIITLGYNWNDPRDIVKAFEAKVADFAGAKYGVAIDCCSHGLFLALRLLCKPTVNWLERTPNLITIPKRTYMSVPMQINHSGNYVGWEDLEWSGVYQLKPFPIWDGATRWKRNMYMGGLHIVSFQIKKRIPIGRGGMILTDNKDHYEWLSKARYDGRNLDGDYMKDVPEEIGWHYYMTPEDAARGLILMEHFNKDEYPDSGGSNNYSDLSQMRCFK